MAELVISKLTETVLSHAIETISELVVQETGSLIGVKGRVKSLQTELRRMQCFLKDADRKQEQDERVRNWLAEVKDVAHEVEDVIEIFITKVSSSYVKVFHQFNLRNKINAIQAKINDIFKSAERYKIEFVTGDGTSSMAKLQQNLRRSCPDDDEDEEIIILEDSMEALKMQLTRMEDRLHIVSVVGMGGLGKTTLAKKVYNDVKQHFDCNAWVFVSQQYVACDILYEILVQIERETEREKLKNLNEHELVDRLKHDLKEKKYLVVLDDIWEIKAWDSIKKAFPNKNQGSKILFTTRNKEVALYADPLISPVELPFLTFNESWELLKRKAFQIDTFGKHGLSPEFEKLGKDMVKKCGGLPLAIVVLGGLLNTKNSIDEWKEVKRNVNAYLNKLQSGQLYEGVHGILALSYHDLPYYLKPCFLYLGCLLKDREIPRKTLIQLWIAEGFIQTPSKLDENETKLEDVAEQYLAELMDRCMVQASERNQLGFEGVKAYRMHDLMRNFCVCKARDENFFQIIQHDLDINMTGVGSPMHLSDATTIHSRRIALHVACDFERHNFPLPLRSLLCSDIDHFPVSSLRRKNFRLLRTLELGGISLKDKFKVLEEICKLIHLRYLGLRRTCISKLPNSVGNLQSLQTLDLRYNHVKLPRGISRLTRLMHLLTSAPLMLKYRGSPPRFDESQLRISGHMKLVSNVLMIRCDALFKLTNLQKLKILLRNKKEATTLLESPITKSSRLRYLDMKMEVYINDAAKDQEAAVFPSLMSLIPQCRFLHKLRLEGPIEEDLHDSSHHCFRSLPTSLTEVTLVCSHMNRHSMAVLEKLPNLRLLRLISDAYCDSEMVCSANGFPKLESLYLFKLRSLRGWRIEKDAMPSLKKLDLVKISQLKMIPEGLKFVTTLQSLDVTYMGPDFKHRLRVEGEDFYKVCHIPSILFSTPI
ncbi:NB-ARC domain, LRR domain containing protein, partial [Trema orientale]